MPFFIDMPIHFSGYFGCASAGDDNDSSPGLDPANKLIAVITSICKNQFAMQISFQLPLDRKNAIDYQGHLLPHGLSWLIRLGFSLFLRDSAFFPRVDFLDFPPLLNPSFRLSERFSLTASHRTHNELFNRKFTFLDVF